MTQTIEVERKWVLPGFTGFSQIRNAITQEIEQRYIDTQNGGFRIRNASGNYTATKKSDGDVARAEAETSITEWLYDELAAISVCGLRKTRWTFTSPDGVKLELDCYHDNLKGLVTIEAEWLVELTTDDTLDESSLLSWLQDVRPEIFNFELPEWLGVARDVSYYHGFKNSSLARHGLPDLF